jgi:hypothetical protein
MAPTPSKPGAVHSCPDTAALCYDADTPVQGTLGTCLGCKLPAPLADADTGPSQAAAALELDTPAVNGSQVVPQQGLLLLLRCS